MSRSAKLGLLALTFVPLTGAVLARTSTVESSISVIEVPAAQGHGLFDQLLPLSALGAVSLLVFVGLIALYLIHLYRTPAMPLGRKALWAAVILLVPVVGMLAYWYPNVWREPPGATAA